MQSRYDCGFQSLIHVCPHVQRGKKKKNPCTHNRTHLGETCCKSVSQCDKDKAQAFSQQGLCSLFVLLQIFVTPRKWPLRCHSQLSVISGPALV